MLHAFADLWLLEARDGRDAFRPDNPRGHPREVVAPFHPIFLGPLN